MHAANSVQILFWGKWVLGSGKSMAQKPTRKQLKPRLQSPLHSCRLDERDTQCYSPAAVTACAPPQSWPSPAWVLQGLSFLSGKDRAADTMRRGGSVLAE